MTQNNQNTPKTNVDKKVDEIFEDLMVGHNFDYAANAIKQLIATEKREAVETLRRISWNDLEQFAEKLRDEESDQWIIDRAQSLSDHYLPKDHPEYWKHHCVTCGLWKNGEPDQEGYCQCE